MSLQYISLMNSKQFSLSPNLTTSCVFMGDCRAISPPGWRTQTREVHCSLPSLGYWAGVGGVGKGDADISEFLSLECMLLLPPIPVSTGKCPSCSLLTWVHLSLEVSSCWRQKLGRDEHCGHSGCLHARWSTTQESFIFLSAINFFLTHCSLGCHLNMKKWFQSKCWRALC